MAKNVSKKEEVVEDGMAVAPPPVEKLHQYIARWRGYQWKWGVHDCCTFAADWVMQKTGIDPMGDLRGAYSSEEEARVLIEEGGGLTAMFVSAMDAVGPLPNAGVVKWMSRDDEFETGALCTQDRVWLFTPKGVAGYQRRLLARHLTVFI